MSTYKILNDFNPDQFNLLIPVQSIQEINPIFKYVQNKVQISTDLADKEIYQEKSAGANMYALTHKALNKLAMAANAQVIESKKITPRVCEKCIEIAKATRIAAKCSECKSAYNVAVQVIMKFPELSGGWHLEMATREIDVSTLSGSDAQKNKVKEFIVEHAESKAKNRCIRKALNIKSAYTIEELEKPFLAIYPTLDAKDPDVKKALIAGSMASSNMLYGTGLQIGAGGNIEALPAAKEVPTTTDDYEVENYNEGQPDEQDGNQGDAPGQNETPADKLYCSVCKAEIAANVAEFSQKTYKKELCFKCQQVEKKKQKGAGK